MCLALRASLCDALLSAFVANDEEDEEGALLGLGDLGDGDPMLLDDDLAHPMTPIAEEPGAANDDPPLEDVERHTLDDDDEGTSPPSYFQCNIEGRHSMSLKSPSLPCSSAALTE